MMSEQQQLSLPFFPSKHSNLAFTNLQSFLPNWISLKIDFFSFTAPSYFHFPFSFSRTQTLRYINIRNSEWDKTITEQKKTLRDSLFAFISLSFGLLFLEINEPLLSYDIKKHSLSTQLFRPPSHLTIVELKEIPWRIKCKCLMILSGNFFFVICLAMKAF